jgi:hypothetical protein
VCVCLCLCVQVCVYKSLLTITKVPAGWVTERLYIRLLISLNPSSTHMKICQDMSRYVKICQDMSRYAMICQDILVILFFLCQAHITKEAPFARRKRSSSTHISFSIHSRLRPRARVLPKAHESCHAPWGCPRSSEVYCLWSCLGSCLGSCLWSCPGDALG